MVVGTAVIYLFGAGWLAFAMGLGVRKALLVGVALGGGMGLWLWFRVLPVPHALDDPASGGRWVLIGAHVAMVVAGVVLVSGAAVAG